ncbi:MAG: NAD(P) transhydrogenase subunit alpha [Pseudomonadota bacterium]
MEAVFLAFVLMLSIFLGFELISKVPATLHTPLMSGANAISGITVVGALASAGAAIDSEVIANILGAAAVALATINVVGGYMVTDRMLSMFKKKETGDAPGTPGN